MFHVLFERAGKRKRNGIDETESCNNEELCNFKAQGELKKQRALKASHNLFNCLR